MSHGCSSPLWDMTSLLGTRTSLCQRGVTGCAVSRAASQTLNLSSPVGSWAVTGEGWDIRKKRFPCGTLRAVNQATGLERRRPIPTSWPNFSSASLLWPLWGMVFYPICNHMEYGLGFGEIPLLKSFIHHRPPSIWHQGPVLWKTIFPWNGVEGLVLGWFKCITFIVYFKFHYYYISSHSDHQTLDPWGWGPLS